MAFITAYSKSTGRPQQIPEGWLDHPVLGRDFQTAPPVTEESADGYEAHTVAELRMEIDRRNDSRDEADRIPVSGLKADLIAALEADDSK